MTTWMNIKDFILVREASLRITYGFIYIIFWERQNYHDAEHIRICQFLGQGVHGYNRVFCGS